MTNTLIVRNSDDLTLKESFSVFDFVLSQDSCFTADLAVITPVRWLASTLIPTALVMHALKSKHVSKSGAALG